MRARRPPEWAVARAAAFVIAAAAFVVPVVLAAVLGLATLSAPGPAAAAAAHARHKKTTTVWLCRPGLVRDPCTRKLTTTAVDADGTRTTETESPTTSSPYDCFFVYPTVSTEPGDNANLQIQPAETDAARDEASPFSQLCEVWAPMYRQTTASALASGVTKIPHHAIAVAYRSLLSAWKDFVAHDDHGRPVIFIGHSQGAALLIRLLRSQVDPNASRRARMVMAILAGGNLQVPTGKTVGATFKHLPLCTKAEASGCVIAYSTFPSEPPKGAVFGRPGTGVSIQSGETATKGQQVACVNPAALGGGKGTLQPYFLSSQFTTVSPPVSTPWVTFPNRYTAECEDAGGATWLDVAATPSTGRPAVNEALGPDWGYHLVDVNLAIGNLLEDVAAAEGAYSHG